MTLTDSEELPEGYISDSQASGRGLGADTISGRYVMDMGREACSLIGTRWLAMRQPIVDLMVKAVYLSLTLGRAVQTLGEEYTDILPRTSRSTRLSRIASCELPFLRGRLTS